MASFENLASLDGWAFRSSSFGDPWISDAFSRDNEALTKALQKSLSGGNADSFDSDSISPFLGLLKPEMSPTPTPTLSGVSGSDQEPALPAAKRQRGATPAPAVAKAGKRKSRASKRSQTTFITADPANFRQMVQQVTGVRFAGGGAPVQFAPILKPEPQRLVGRYQGLVGGGGCLLPTLDTSAFLLDHQQQAVGGGGMVPVSFPQPGVAADGGVSSGSGFQYSDFSNFPTLESWKVM